MRQNREKSYERSFPDFNQGRLLVLKRSLKSMRKILRLGKLAHYPKYQFEDKLVLILRAKVMKLTTLVV